MRKSQKNLFALPARDLADILRLAGDEFEELRGQKLLLTGGTGFFGKWLLGALCHANQELGFELHLTVLSRDPAAFQRRHPEVEYAPGLDFVRGDVAYFSPNHRRFDFIIHAATDNTAFTTDAEERERSRTIVAGTRRMLDLAINGRTRRFLNLSSGAVYGTLVSKPTGANEDDYHQAVPLTPYAEAKREAERLCAESGVHYVSARAFAFLGPHLPLDAHFAAGNFLRDARRGGPIVVKGDGTALRSYLYPTDLVTWLLRLLLHGQRERGFNVASDEVVSIAQLARLIAQAVEPKPEVIIQSAQAPGPQNIYLADLWRARHELNLHVTVPLQDAITRTVEFLGENQT